MVVVGGHLASSLVPCFFVLGFLGTRPATGVYTTLARVFTVLYFAFFLLMPIYTKLDKTKPVPERVTYHD